MITIAATVVACLWCDHHTEVKLAGNAVTPPVARDLVAVAVTALGGAA